MPGFAVQLIGHADVDCGKVRDIAGTDSEVSTQGIPVNEGTLVGDGKIRKAGETRFRQFLYPTSQAEQ